MIPPLARKIYNTLCQVFPSTTHSETNHNVLDSTLTSISLRVKTQALRRAQWPPCCSWHMRALIPSQRLCLLFHQAEMLILPDVCGAHFLPPNDSKVTFSLKPSLNTYLKLNQSFPTKLWCSLSSFSFPFFP